VELSAVTDELYGLPLNEFTSTRDERASEARRAGETELANALKRLRKPSTSAWIANMLVRDQSREVERLINLGTTLRSDEELDGARIRRATKEKADTVNKLLQRARSIANRKGLAVSEAIEQELEATLDAAFSDPGNAQSLRAGRLTSALVYSGLGFGSLAKSRGASARSRGPARARSSPETTRVTAAVDMAEGEAKRADLEVQKAQRAVKTAEAELKRLRLLCSDGSGLLAQRWATALAVVLEDHLRDLPRLQWRIDADGSRGLRIPVTVRTGY
jgi:hypothetical protein